MDKKEQKEYIKELRKFGKELIGSKEKAEKFLQDAGIHTKTGKLTKPYKKPAVQK